MKRVLDSLRGDQLRARAMRGSAVSVLSMGLSQLLRLASNLVLTRLLFPEAFGQMALVSVILTGLMMVSDVGLAPAVIQHPDGEDERFLGTVWSIQIVRGFMLWLLTCALAWPAAAIYGEPELAYLLPASGLGLIISGFRSVHWLTAGRRLHLTRIVAIDLTGQVAGILTMVAWAHLSPSTWALVVGGWAGSLTATSLSHRVLGGLSIRPIWDTAHARHLVRFGRWIFLSTSVTYIAGEGLRAIQGVLVSTDTLSFITIATGLSGSISAIAMRVASGVLLPAVAEIARNNPDRLADATRRSQTILLGVSLPPILALALMGTPLIEFLYDPRYHRSGILLSILAVNSGLSLLPIVYQNALLAKGDARTHSHLICILAALRVTGTLVGYAVGDDIGMLFGGAVASALYYAPIYLLTRRLGLTQASVDIPAFAALVLCGYMTAMAT